MSADQELAATGASGIIPLFIAGVVAVAAGVALLWRKIAKHGADSAS